MSGAKTRAGFPTPRLAPDGDFLSIDMILPTHCKRNRRQHLTLQARVQTFLLAFHFPRDSGAAVTNEFPASGPHPITQEFPLGETWQERVRMMIQFLEGPQRCLRSQARQSQRRSRAWSSKPADTAGPPSHPHCAWLPFSTMAPKALPLIKTGSFQDYGCAPPPPPPPQFCKGSLAFLLAAYFSKHCALPPSMAPTPSQSLCAVCLTMQWVTWHGTADFEGDRGSP